jgi:niacin transporter
LSASGKTRLITHTALYLALAVLLPVAFHAFGILGRVFLPMHLPVLLAGMLVGPLSGLIVGLAAPFLSNLTTGMPPTYAVPLMALELPIYGLIAGILFQKFKLNVYLALILAMVAGRIAFGLSLLILGAFIDLPYTAAIYFSAGGVIVTGLPGIALQVILVPVIVMAVSRVQGKSAG